jgi:hypothetical protein
VECDSGLPSWIVCMLEIDSGILLYNKKYKVI